MAADSQLTSGELMDLHVRKVHRRKGDGALVGFAGYASHGRAFTKWFLGGEKGARPSLGDSDDNCSTAIVVRPNGLVEFHDRRGTYTPRGDYFVAGSGADIALGAMAAGASARKAVKIAIEYDTQTGGKINWARLR